MLGSSLESGRLPAALVRAHAPHLRGGRLFKAPSANLENTVPAVKGPVASSAIFP
jgi:hypothetical protein